VSTNLVVNQEIAPFNDERIRKAIALMLDRKAFIDILRECKSNISGAMLPPPEGVGDMPPEVLHTLPGYSADVEKSLGYGQTSYSK
jgi:peptide/nickel transport system substrate-binding protein